MHKEKSVNEALEVWIAKLNGKPIDGPIIRYVPFVMNTHEFKYVGAGPPSDMPEIACKASFYNALA